METTIAKVGVNEKDWLILDVGAGIGQFLSIARHSYHEVYGTEVSRTAADLAKQRYGLALFEGTLEGLDFRGQLFHDITLFHVLEHVHSPRSLIERCHSFLTDGGILVIAVPNEVASLRAFFKRLLMNLGMKRRNGAGKLGLHRITMGSTGHEVHLSHFTPQVLRGCLRGQVFRYLRARLIPTTWRQPPKLKADAYVLLLPHNTSVFRRECGRRNSSDCQEKQRNAN